MIFKILRKGIRGAANYCTRAMSSDRYVWIDMEMTGLDPEKDKILEIACIITTPHLDVVHSGINLVIHQPEEVLRSMNAWCIEHHMKTGLSEASRKSKISLGEAETTVFELIKRNSISDGVNYLAGNSVYMDRLFLMKYMPKVNSLLHYRLVDVSSLKTLCNHWYPEEFEAIQCKKQVHRALDDIQESIDELKKYKSLFFK